MHLTLPGRALYTAEWMIYSGGHLWRWRAKNTATCDNGATMSSKQAKRDWRHLRSRARQMEVDVGAET